MSFPSLRDFIGFLCALIMTWAGAAQAQQYPSRPIRLIVPFAAGGTSDILARIVGDRLSTSLGQPVIIENRVGAGGTIGTEAIAKAAPDGYTLGMGTVSTLNVNPIVYRAMGFSVQKDLAPVTNIAAAPLVLVVGPGAQVQSIEQLVAAAKAAPNRYTYGSPGVGSLGHFTGEYFKLLTRAAGILHAPYKGSSSVVNDLLGGQLDLTFDYLPSVLPHIAGGKLRALAVAAPKRLESLPGVPTFAEAGYPQLNEMSSWVGLVVPSRTPPAIVNRLQAELKLAMERPEFVEKIKQAGAFPVVNSASEFAEQIRLGLERTRDVAASAGIKLD